MEKVYIKVNKAGAKTIQELLDIALKSGGINALQGATHVLNIMEVDEKYFSEKAEKEKVEKNNK